MTRGTETVACGMPAERRGHGVAARGPRRALLLGLSVATTLAAPASWGQTSKETVNVVGQGPGGPVVSVNGATLWRSNTGLSASLTMPTPAPGTYAYPPPNAFQDEVFVGHPEAFSFWMFVFNFPELCTAPCDANDFAPAPAMGGAFNAGGHVVGGPNLQLSGRVSINSEPFRGGPLLEPRTAEVHLAVAPHGALQPDLMPVQITFPIGSSPFWWLAMFIPE